MLILIPINDHNHTKVENRFKNIVLLVSQSYCTIVVHMLIRGSYTHTIDCLYFPNDYSVSRYMYRSSISMQNVKTKVGLLTFF
jgi:hypothetical protein